MNTKELAQHRWRQILPALGVPIKFLDGKHQPCPLCGGKDRAHFDDKDGQGTYFCHQCGAGTGFTLLQKMKGWDFATAAREVDKILGMQPKQPRKPYTRALMTREEVAKMWREAKPLQDGDPVTSYLIRRFIGGLAHWPVALRFMDRWKHRPSEKFLPCMFALYQAADGSVGTIHRTYLADVEPNWMFLPCSIPVGGAIRLFEPGPEMGIAEGIETALSASILLQMPVWATTCARLLRAWQPPAEAKRITIFGDNDASCTGQAAAWDLAHRLALRKHHKVKVLIPDGEGRDWNDVLKDDYAAQLMGGVENETQSADGGSGEAATDMSALRPFHETLQPALQPIRHTDIRAKRPT